MNSILQKIFSFLPDNSTKRITAKNVRDSFKLLDDKIYDLEIGISGSVSTNMTLAELNQLDDGIYDAQTVGSYANGFTANSGFITRFQKKGTTWSKIEIELPAIPIEQTTGSSTTKVISQKVVSEKFSKLEKSLFPIEQSDVVTLNKYSDFSNGNIKDNSSVDILTFAVQQDTDYYIDAKVASISYYNGNPNSDTFISGINDVDENTLPLKITAPTNAKFVVLNIAKAVGSTTIETYNGKYIKKEKDLVKKSLPIELADIMQLNVVSYYSNGKISESYSSDCGIFFALEGENYKLPSIIGGVNAYSGKPSESTFIGQITAEKSGVFKAPPGCRFFAINIPKTGTTTMSVYRNMYITGPDLNKLLEQFENLSNMRQREFPISVEDIVKLNEVYVYSTGEKITSTTNDAFYFKINEGERYTLPMGVQGCVFFNGLPSPAARINSYDHLKNEIMGMPGAKFVAVNISKTTNSTTQKTYSDYFIEKIDKEEPINLYNYIKINTVPIFATGEVIDHSGFDTVFLFLKPNTRYKFSSPTKYDVVYYSGEPKPDNYMGTSGHVHLSDENLYVPNKCKTIALIFKKVDGASIENYKSIFLKEYTDENRDIKFLDRAKFGGMNILLDNEEFRVYGYKPVGKSGYSYKSICATGGNVVVMKHSSFEIEISENGTDGLECLEKTTNGLAGKNNIDIRNSLPDLLPDSTIDRVYVLGYARESRGNRHINDYRVIVTTNFGQVYHNKPNRAVDLKDTPLEGDHLLFEESVIWDLPHRRLPHKTSNEFPYRKNPCLPEIRYTERHPALNTSSGFVDKYGSGGFGDFKIDNNKKYARYYHPYYEDSERCPLSNLNGYVQTNGKMYIGTYNAGNTYRRSSRICVFESSDGREFYNKYEFIQTRTCGNTLDISTLPNYGPNTLAIIDRRPTFPTESLPNPATLFDNTSKVEISSMVMGEVKGSLTERTIIVTTTTPHNLQHDQNIIAIKTADGKINQSQYDFFLNNTVTSNDYGNEIFWGARKLNDLQFELYEYVSASNNNLVCEHIHSVNENKDGITIGTGEDYFVNPGYLADSMAYVYPESHFIYYNKVSDEFTKLNTSEKGIQRTLGCVILDDENETVFHGSDAAMLSSIERKSGNVTLKKSGYGLWKGKLSDINDRSKFHTVVEASALCFLFGRYNGVYVFSSDGGTCAVSIDGKRWSYFKSMQTIMNFNGVNDLGQIALNAAIVIRK